MMDSGFVDVNEDTQAAKIDDFNFEDVLKEELEYTFVYKGDICDTRVVKLLVMDDANIMCSIRRPNNILTIHQKSFSTTSLQFT